MDTGKKIISAKELNDEFIQDIYRPAYHFICPLDLGLPGDPNGAFYANGRYHLMYLYRNEATKGYHWGHMSSTDLLHWRHHPDALFPDESDGGAYSGGAFVDEDGTAYLSYWRLPANGDRINGKSGIGLAISKDYMYEKWEKTDTLLEGTEFGIMDVMNEDGESVPLGNSDPSNIWKHNGIYYMQTGNLQILERNFKQKEVDPRYLGPWNDLFYSTDLKTWKFISRFYDKPSFETDIADNEDSMCPSFLPLPADPEGEKESGKYLQLFISHNRGCQYYVGSYNGGKFICEKHGRMSWVDDSFFAPEALVGPDKRQIMWSWLRDDYIHNNSKGWNGVFSMPRNLWYENGLLHMAPIQEMRSLRYNYRTFDAALTLSSNDYLDVKNIAATEFVISLANKDYDVFGLKFEHKDNPKDHFEIYHDAKNKQLVVDNTHCAALGRKAKETAPFDPTNNLLLNIFIDKPVLEVFANNIQAITRRNHVDIAQYKVKLFAIGNAKLLSLETYEISPTNPT